MYNVLTYFSVIVLDFSNENVFYYSQSNQTPKLVLTNGNVAVTTYLLVFDKLCPSSLCEFGCSTTTSHAFCSIALQLERFSESIPTLPVTISKSSSMQLSQVVLFLSRVLFPRLGCQSSRYLGRRSSCATHTQTILNILLRHVI